jgi:hypothetical protein
MDDSSIPCREATRNQADLTLSQVVDMSALTWRLEKKSGAEAIWGTQLKLLHLPNSTTTNP